MNQTNGMNIVEEDLFKPIKKKYDKAQLIMREYLYYPFRIKVAIFLILIALFFLVADLFILNESHGFIYWLNMGLFFLFLGSGFYVLLKIEILIKTYKNGKVYYYETLILGFIPKITRKKEITEHEFVKSRFNAYLSQRESDKD